MFTVLRLVGSGTACKLYRKLNLYLGSVCFMWIWRLIHMHRSNCFGILTDSPLLPRRSQVCSEVWRALGWILSSGAVEDVTWCFLIYRRQIMETGVMIPLGLWAVFYPPIRGSTPGLHLSSIKKIPRPSGVQRICIRHDSGIRFTYGYRVHQ